MGDKTKERFGVTQQERDNTTWVACRYTGMGVAYTKKHYLNMLKQGRNPDKNTVSINAFFTLAERREIVRPKKYGYLVNPGNHLSFDTEQRHFDNESGFDNYGYYTYKQFLDSGFTHFEEWRQQKGFY